MIRDGLSIGQLQRAMLARWDQQGLPGVGPPTVTTPTVGNGFLQLGEPDNRYLRNVLRFSYDGGGEQRVFGVVALLDLSHEEPFLEAPEEIRRLTHHISQFSAYVRAHLSDAGHADDLSAWAVGPPGSDVSPGWQALQFSALRDQMVCPKHVWLPPREEGKVDGSLQAFLDQTFLGRPWAVENRASVSVNPVAGILQQLADKASLTPDQVQELVRLLIGDSEAADQAERAQPFLKWMHALIEVADNEE